MTVLTAYEPLLYSGNGATQSFDVTWPFFTGSLVVTRIVSGVETELTINVDYTVTGGTDGEGKPGLGSVIFGTAPASGTQIRIERDTPLTQGSTWDESDNFPQAVVESGLDKSILIAQEIAGKDWSGPKGDQGATGPVGPVGPPWLDWKGAWSAGTYAAGDGVEHNGSTYRANTETGEEPPHSDWDLIVSKGDKGDQGEPGDSFDPDAFGTFAERDAHDSEDPGFSYLSIDGDGDEITTAVIFILISTGPAVWSDPIPFQGPQGPQGPQSFQIVRLAATANVDLAEDLEDGKTVDDVVVVEGDAVLLAFQTDAAENGPYIVPASGAAARHPVFDIFDTLPGVYFSVMEGDEHADTLWRVTSDKGGTLGTDPVEIEEFRGGGGAGRELLTAPRVYYVRTDGDDGNDGLADSAGGAFATIQKAVDTVAALDLGIHDVTIQIGNGTYAIPVVLKSLIGAGTVTLRGNPSSPSDVEIAVNGATIRAISATNIVGDWRLDGVRLTTTGTGGNSACLYASGAATTVGFQNVDIGPTQGRQILVENGAVVSKLGPYFISGGGLNHLFIRVGAIYNSGVSGNATFVGAGLTANFSGNFCSASTGSIVFHAVGSYVDGGSVTGIRYHVQRNSVCQTVNGSSTFFPGDVDGVVESGGQYV